MVDAMSNLGLFSKMRLTADASTGKITGGSDTFINAAEELYEGTMAEAKKKENQKDSINLKVAELSLLQSNITDLQTKTNFLYNTDGIGNYGVFSNMYASYTSTSSTPVSQLMDLNLSSEANLQEFTLEIDQVATYDLCNATVGVADPTVALGWSGNYTINGQAIPIVGTMSLNDIATLINIQTSVADVSAVVVQVTSTDYRLSLQSTALATPITIVDGTTGPAVGQMPAASGKTINDLNAQFIFNNIPMTRTTNSISDIVNGLTLVLKQKEVGTTVTVDLAPDTVSITAAINDWVTSINTVMDEVNKNRMSFGDNPQVPDDAPLLNTNIIRAIDALIRESLPQRVTGLGTNSYTYLEEIGLNIDSITSKITIDLQVLDQAMKTNPRAIEKLFDFQSTISNSSFLMPEHPGSVNNDLIEDSSGNALSTTVTVSKDGSGNLSATVTVSGGVYSGQTYTIPASAIQTRGDVISFTGDGISNPPVNNPFSGFEFLYVGISNIANGASDSSTIQYTQGIADRLSSGLAELLDDTSGDFIIQKDDFTNQITRLDDAITKIQEKAEKLKEKFLADFARLEAFRQSLAPIEGMIASITRSMSNGR